MTNESIDPNKYLKAFYSNMALCNGLAFIGPQTVNTYPWWDTGFTTHTQIDIPKHTKKAVFRVIIPEGTIAPKYPVFVSLDGLTTSDISFNNDGSIDVISVSSDPSAIALLDGSEIEVYGYKEIIKTIFFNNRVKVGAPTQPSFNANPINFLLNITLYK